MNRYMWIITLCIAAFFVNNGALQTDIMESRNIVTAREMVSDGNWLVPTMNGELRLEKPPLPTWVAAVVETVVPDNLKAQRAAADDGRGMDALLLSDRIGNFQKEGICRYCDLGFSDLL